MKKDILINIFAISSLVVFAAIFTPFVLDTINDSEDRRIDNTFKEIIDKTYLHTWTWRMIVVKWNVEFYARISEGY